MNDSINLMTHENHIEPPIILYDDICHLCTSTVNFVIRRDSKKVFRFASLQSSIGQQFLKKFGLPRSNFKTFVFIKQETIFTKSSAALQVVKHLDGFWPILYMLILIPLPIRNFFYDWIAKNRYRLFGKRTSCFVPTKDHQDRFL
ncbi:thiol-disulfide oxidoreductase DCC family protein [Nitrospira defluvii]|nr:thiol-disulfide oxidoreductase DCC family protein [Nitrospira defluvii]